MRAFLMLLAIRLDLSALVEVTICKSYKLGRKSSLTLAQDAPAGSLC